MTPSYNAPKSKDAMAYLDGLVVNLVSSKVPPLDVQTEALHPFVGRPPRKTHPSTLVEAPPIFVLDEGHAFSLLFFFFFLKRKFLTLPRPFLCQAMAKFYATSQQARELSDDVKVLAKKNKLEDELRLKKGERIRLGEELTCLQVVEKELGN